MIIALYKGQDRLFNRLVSWWTKGPYSHVELIFETGHSASSSFRDGGVRVKKIEYKPEKWDFIVLPYSTHGDRARDWFYTHCKDKYDLAMLGGFVWGALPDSKDKWACSESVLAALGYKDAWRFDPNDMPSLLKLPVIRGCDFDFQKYGVPKYESS